ncbi:hypothetical protein BHE74_00035120 [Ensete ventricosum]|nr:hypothetical protein BHE74_00035120 [Ensete ventricosum]
MRTSWLIDIRSMLASGHARPEIVPATLDVVPVVIDLVDPGPENRRRLDRAVLTVPTKVSNAFFGSTRSTPMTRGAATSRNPITSLNFLEPPNLIESIMRQQVGSCRADCTDEGATRYSAVSRCS